MDSRPGVSKCEVKRERRKWVLGGGGWKVPRPLAVGLGHFLKVT